MQNSASRNSRPVPAPRTSSGVQRGNRDQRRMADFIGRKEFVRPGGWGENREEEYLTSHPQPSQQRKQRNMRRAVDWKKKPPTEQSGDAASAMPPNVPTDLIDTDRYQSVKSTPLKDDPMFTFTQGSRQMIKRRCQNLDFSSFPQLCDVTYRQLLEHAPRLRREMPYTSFLHAMNCILQAWIIDTARNVNQESRWQDEDLPLSCIPREMILPAPIAEYLSLINTNITPAGDTIRVNVPDAIVPTIEEGGIPSGTFDRLVAANHNSYEINLAPYVTMRNVQSQAQNQQLDPLPEDFVFEGAQPNRNLLGCVPFVPAAPDARAQLQEYVFEEGQGIAARLCLCPMLMVDVSSALHRLSDKYKMVKVQDLTRKPNLACTVFNSYPVRRAGVANTAIIAEQTPTIYAFFAFGTTTASQTTIFGFKKQRTEQVRGLCFTQENGNAAPLWVAHMNNAFNMVGIYAPTIDRDYAALRTQDAIANPEDDPLINICADWARKFVIKR